MDSDEVTWLLWRETNIIAETEFFPKLRTSSFIFHLSAFPFSLLVVFIFIIYIFLLFIFFPVTGFLAVTPLLVTLLIVLVTPVAVVVEFCCYYCYCYHYQYFGAYTDKVF